jgi:protein subunit release factor A
MVMKTKKQIEKEGFKVIFTNGTGNGGQKRNRTYSCAVVTHEETGLSQRCDDTTSANRNMKLAYERIEVMLKDQKKCDTAKKLNERRQEAMSRGNIRTYDYKRGVVKNHLTGKEASLKKVINGDIELIQ